MKKILFVALGVTLLTAGCQKTEIIGLDNSQNGPAMTFSTEMKKITKADEDELTYPHPNATGDKNLQAQGFNIWAYADYDIETATNVTKETGIFDGMENWYVGYNSATTTWSSNKSFYWPGKGKKLHFFAVSGSKKKEEADPEENLFPSNYGVINTPKFTVNMTSTPNAGKMQMEIPSYTVSAQANDDLMVADFLTQDQDSKGTETNAVKGKVALNFRHTLSKVQFIFSTLAGDNTPDVYIQKLTVTNLNNTGKLVVTAKEEEKNEEENGTLTVDDTEDTNVPITTIVEPRWTGQSGTASFEVESSNELKLASPIDYVYHEVTKDDETTNEKEYESSCGDKLTVNNDKPLITWLMMPQTLTEDSQIEVFYLIGNRQFKAVFPLAPDSESSSNKVTSWGENTFTKYNIILAPNLITFSASSTEWENAKNVDHQN